MPQIFQVLSCYKCEMFQVHQVKKSTKWQCRVCNEKQSLKKAFKIGSSKDCRALVQRLNMLKSGHIEEENENLEVCESNDWSECENKAPELLNYTESGNRSYSAEEDFENSDSAIIENDSRYYSVSKNYENDVAIGDIDFLFENSKVCKTSQCSSDDALFQKVEDTNLPKSSDCQQVVERKAEKHPLEIQGNSSRSTTLPPLKKNRGFQFILNAASKLN